MLLCVCRRFSLWIVNVSVIFVISIFFIVGFVCMFYFVIGKLDCCIVLGVCVILVIVVVGLCVGGFDYEEY